MRLFKKKNDLPQKASRLHFPLIIFLVCLLFTVLVWDHYFNSSEPLNYYFISNLVLAMGTLFSIFAAMFSWSLEKNYKIMKEAAADAQKRQQEIEVAYHQLQLAQSQLKEAMLLNEATVNTSLNAFISFTKEGNRIISFNPSAEKIFGYLPGKILWHSIDDILGAQDPSQLAQIKSLLLNKLGVHHEISGKRPDGSLFPMEAVVAASTLSGSTIYIATFRDLTERKHAEEALRLSEMQLRQAQKMDAIGRLAGGVAHDFNNLLTAIIGCSDLLLARLPKGNPHLKIVEEIKKASEQAALLTSQLLAFSRKGRRQVKVLDLNSLVAEMGSLLQRLTGDRIEFIQQLEPALDWMKADAGQVQQVLLNLVVNARDAMPDRGKLTIQTANVALDEAYARNHMDAKAGRYVMLAVSDTGAGMSPEIQAHLFEPFFTTKEKGSGLGLATVYGIVKQSGGNIFVYSEVGKGAIFKVYFPRVEAAEEARPTPELKPASVEILRGNETILLVEDEVRVRIVAEEILSSSGYQVLAASSSDEAQKLSQAHPGQIHLMLTDVAMPKVSGVELAQQMAVARPEMKVLYMSGYTDLALFQQGLLAPGISFLEKPFTPALLTRKIREVLDSHGRKEEIA